MIQYQNKFGPIIRKTIYHADCPSYKVGLLCVYRSTKCNNSHWGFHRKEYNTIINSLDLSEDELLNSFNPKTRQKIRRAIKDNLFNINTFASLDDFIMIYNRFANSRGWKETYRKNAALAKYQQVTTCSYNDEIIIAHLYTKDPDSGRVLISFGLSILDEISDTSVLSIIGRANCYLYYMDMLHFRECGFKEFDWGGYDTYDSDDPKKKGINQFKKGFNGAVVYESNYTSYPLYWLYKLRALLFLS